MLNEARKPEGQIKPPKCYGDLSQGKIIYVEIAKEIVFVYSVRSIKKNLRG